LHGTYRQFSNPSFSVGSQKECIVGATIGNLDQTSHKEASPFKFNQSHTTVNYLPLKQGLHPQNIAILVDTAEKDTACNRSNQVGFIPKANHTIGIFIEGRITKGGLLFQFAG
jgi:hypothetical protein